MCVCVCVYVCMYVCIYACIHTCMYVCMHACMYVYTCVCMYTHTQCETSNDIRVYVCIHITSVKRAMSGSAPAGGNRHARTTRVNNDDLVRAILLVVHIIEYKKNEKKNEKK